MKNSEESVIVIMAVGMPTAPRSSHTHPTASKFMGMKLRNKCL